MYTFSDLIAQYLKYKIFMSSLPAETQFTRHIHCYHIKLPDHNITTSRPYLDFVQSGLGFAVGNGAPDGTSEPGSEGVGRV